MSNETDLDWLARNVHEWPFNIFDAKPTEKYVWNQSREGGDIIVIFRDNPSVFTKGQWLSRRTELQNKPSWKDVSGWVQWLAQDEDGEWFCYEKEPSRGDSLFRHASGFVCYAQAGCVLGDWRETLERRPSDLSGPAVTARLTEATENVLTAAPGLMTDRYKFEPFTSIEDSQEQGMKQDNGWFERGELPPIGVWCEAYCNGAEPEKCKILAYHKQQVAVQWSKFNQGCLDVLEMQGWSFRPTRSEREAAVSEMMAVAAANWGNLADCCEALYDAGYRKEGK